MEVKLKNSCQKSCRHRIETSQKIIKFRWRLFKTYKIKHLGATCHDRIKAVKIVRTTIKNKQIRNG